MELEILFKIGVSLLAGVGAGLGTGFAGMSASAVITPLLIGLLSVSPFTAMGIALASDVLASAVSAYTFKKNKNIDLKNAWVMMVFVLIFTVVGSYVGSFTSPTFLGGYSILTSLFMGVKFLVRPITEPKNPIKNQSKKSIIIKSVICGAGIGFICGFVGGGGGLTMLFILTVVMGYDLKKAIGTSVFIMTFTALTGALSHFSLGEDPDLLVLGFCIIFTLIFSLIGAKIANRVSAKTLNRVVGIILLFITALIMIPKII